ncbi:MAG: DUF1934 domain-containing protein [Epulopiscium sp.]|nr:DUF1934 domain-containing protein [Candidatus Epulonipiscium sp.]
MKNTQKGQKVILSILGTQKYEGHEDAVEIVAPGYYYIKNNKEYLTYKEENEDKEDTVTTIKIDNGKVSVMRFGGINSNMTFELNKKHTTYYDTSQGALVISVLAKKINTDLYEGEGEIKITYEMEINHASMGINFLNIKINSTVNQERTIPTSCYLEHNGETKNLRSTQDDWS